jgi:hypothetical protein
MIRNFTGAAIAIAILLSPLQVCAQDARSLTPEQKQTLEELADKLKAAIETGDMAAVTRASAQLSLGVSKQHAANQLSPQETFANLEKTTPASGVERFYALSNLAKAAFDGGDDNKAEMYARELLNTAPQYTKDWNNGNAVFFGNMIVGRVALRREKNVALAKSSLLASGQTKGSPQLNSFGPNMSLAKDLIEAGERDTVVEFFKDCAKFWASQFSKLDEWTSVVKNGGMPQFGANLKY